jgi:hypothetical protein
MSVYKDSSIENITLDSGEGKRPPFLFLLLVAGLGFSAFFTGTTLIPSIANNIGPFEAIVLALFIILFIYFLRNRLLVQFHFTITMLFLIVVVAVLSLPNLSDRIDWGVTQLALLVYNALLVLILFNLLIQFPQLIKNLLRFVVLGAFVAGFLVIYEGIALDATIGTGGPFRNRSHVGIYMVTAFWLILLYFYWPGVSKFERIAAIGAIFVVLYGIAVSGRRSVYLSLFVGLALLTMSFIILRGKGRFKLPISVIVAGGILLVMAQIGPRYVPQLAFFTERIALIDDRLALAVGTGDEIEDSDNFIVLQRGGMFAAVGDHPLIGIGWGGFFDSEYSPTGHEMHSTPQRFLAELGIIGFSFYVLYNIYLGVGSARLFWRSRHTQYQLPALIFMVAIWSLSISWAYNRSVTERTYWLLIILFISVERLMYAELARRERSEARKRPRRASYYPRPERPQPSPGMPFSRK